VTLHDYTLLPTRAHVRRFVTLSILTVPLVCLACANEPPTSGRARPAEGPSQPATVQGHRVFGTVHALDRLPAVVTLESRDGREFPRPPEQAVMDQSGLMFSPEMLFVRTGQPVGFLNSDIQIHNVNVKHDATKEQAFNVAIPMGGGYRHVLPRDGLYTVTCDIHTMIAAWIVSTSTPFVTAADSSGRFQFDGVPKGAYALVAYVGTRRIEEPIEVSDSDVEATLQDAEERSTGQT